MPLLRVERFDGAEPRTSPTALDDNRAQRALNSKLSSYDIAPWRGPAPIASPVVPNAKTIYRLRQGDSSVWLSFASYTVIASSALPADMGRAIYYSDGSSGLRYTDWDLAVQGAGPYPAGNSDVILPAPSVAPVCEEVSGTSLNPESRAYVATFVRLIGGRQEESPPSPPKVIDIGAGKAVRLTYPGSIPSNVIRIRFYRSRPTTFESVYAYVGETAIPPAPVLDNFRAIELGFTLTTNSGGAVLPNIRCPVNHSSGAMAGFVGNTVYFSIPYKPHIWPFEFGISIPHTIVALAAFGNSILVLTTQHPYLITGDLPGEMAVNRLPIAEPCVSAASVAVFSKGVLYASPHGIVHIGPGSRQIVSAPLWHSDDWQKLSPDKIVAAVYNEKYYFSTETSTPKTFIVDFSDRPSLVELGVAFQAAYVDEQTGEFFYVPRGGGLIHELDQDSIRPMPFEWLSKRFVLPRAASFSALKLDADFSDNQFETAYNQQMAQIQAQNQTLYSTATGALNTHTLNTFTINGSEMRDVNPNATLKSVAVTIYAEGSERWSKQISSWNPVRIKPFKSRDVEIKITGTIPVRSVRLATTVEELRD